MAKPFNMAIKKIKLKFNKIDLDEEVDDVLQDLVDFSMSASSTCDAAMEGQRGISETLVDKHFETIERLKLKLIRMYKFKK